MSIQLPTIGSPNWGDDLNTALEALAEGNERGGALEAQAAAARAEEAAAAVEAKVITDLGTTDGQAAALVDTPGSQTATAVLARITAEVKAKQARNILDYGVVRGTATSQTAAIKAALDAYPERTFYFPPGDYRLDTGLVITARNSLSLDPDARLYAGAAMGTLITYDPTNDYAEDRHIIGGTLDGALLADRLLSLTGVIRLTLTRTTFIDGIKRGLVTEAGPGAEVFGYDLRFHNTGTTNVTDNIAVEAKMGDCHFRDVVIRDWTVSVKDTASNKWERVHPWISGGAQATARYPSSVAFDLTGASDLMGCLSDTYRTGYRFRTNGSGFTPRSRLLNCAFMLPESAMSAAFANANPAAVLDNTDSVGARVNVLTVSGHATATTAAAMLTGGAANLTVRHAETEGFVTGVDEYTNGVKQGLTTFTPSIVGTSTAGTPTYSGRTGRAFVDGKTVRASIRLAGTFDNTLAGELRITGLPFASSAFNLAAGTVGYWALTTLTKTPVPYSGGSSTDVLLGVEGTGSLGGIYANDLRLTAFELWVDITYEIA